MFSDFSEKKKKKERQGNETATWYFALQLCTLHHTLKSRQTSPSAWWWKREQNPAKGTVFWEKRNEVLVFHSWQSSSVFQTSGIQINRTREEIFCKCLITALIHGMVLWIYHSVVTQGCLLLFSHPRKTCIMLFGEILCLLSHYNHKFWHCSLCYSISCVNKQGIKVH